MSENKKIEFYGGSIGPWIPVLFMIIGMMVGTKIGGGGLLRFSLITFLSLAIGFLLCKDKKCFGEISFGGLSNRMLGVIIIAFLLAGILSQLLRQSGLISALVWVASLMHLNAAFIPLICFIICVLISTACGTSSGAVTAVAPVMIPVAMAMDCHIGLVCGAIISGAIFGDNLAPISDTTIGSALTQEAQIKDVVRTRLPYSLIAGVISAVLFVIFGFMMTGSNAAEAITADGSHKVALFLLILPVLMIVMMLKGWDLVSTLIVCDIVGIVLNLVLRTIPVYSVMAEDETVAVHGMFSNEGPIVAGMSGMMNLLLYVILLFQILEILNVSGAFDKLMGGMLKFVKTERSGELVCMIGTAICTACAGGSSPAVMFFGPMVRRVTKQFNIDRTRGANILDGTACGISGVLPYGTGPMLCVTFAAAAGMTNFSYTDIIPYCFHCILLLVLFLGSILTGVGRRKEVEK